LIVLSKIDLVKLEQVVVLKWSMILNLTGEYDVIFNIIIRNTSVAFSWFFVNRKLFNHSVFFFLFYRIFFGLFSFVYFPTSPILLVIIFFFLLLLYCSILLLFLLSMWMDE
jgi:hypothetical protein